jgi:hypothetical protein
MPGSGSWRETLRVVGVLSREQLARYFGAAWEVEQAQKEVVVYRGALWEPDRFGRGARRSHRLWVAEAYLRMQAQGTPFCWRAPQPGSWPCPDALIQLGKAGDQVVALEVDAGTETRRQWQAKLDGYRRPHLGIGGIWILAAGSPRRVDRLRGWIGEVALPYPWWLESFERWQGQPPPLPALPPAPPPATSAPATVYQLSSGVELDPGQAQTWLARGAQVVGRKLEHQRVVLILSEKPRPKV